MGKAIDLTGKKFGRLTVIKRIGRDKYYHSTWLCKCECGKEKICNGKYLKEGKTKSCGCLYKETVKKNGKKNKGKNIKNLVGMKFGRLTVTELTNKRDINGCVIYKCKCECGSYKDVSSRHLLDGNIQSCGCLARENVKKVQPIAVEKSCYKNTRPCMLNSKIYSNNTSGYSGVDILHGKWRARIKFQGNEYYLGRFDNIEDAIKTRKEAEEKYFNPIIEEFKNKQQK